MNKPKSKKSTTKTYLFHEISSYLPLLEGEEFDALVEDIRQFGQIEVAVLFEGKILDGRNRYRVCKQLGIELEVREWKPSEATGMTPLQFVISENIMRRHLNIAQKLEIGMLLYPDIKKQVKEEGDKKRSETQKEPSVSIETVPSETYKKWEKSSTASKVAEKVKVSPMSIKRAKKIKEIAEGYTDKNGRIYDPEPLIAEEWEKAKREEISVSTVYDKAKLVEEAQNLPLRQKTEVMKALKKEEIPVKELRKVLQEKKDDVERLELAKKSVALRKQQEEMEILYKRIENYKNKIEGFKDSIKNSEAKLKVLTDEIIGIHPQWKGMKPEALLTKMSLYYDNLDTEIYNDQLSELRIEYSKLINPLKEKIRKLEEEYDTKKKEITKQKTEKENEIKALEKYDALLHTELDKIEIDESNIKKDKKNLEALLKEYDEKYK